jgi:hypothetical protein
MHPTQSVHPLVEPMFSAAWYRKEQTSFPPQDQDPSIAVRAREGSVKGQASLREKSVSIVQPEARPATGNTVEQVSAPKPTLISSAGDSSPVQRTIPSIQATHEERTKPDLVPTPEAKFQLTARPAKGIGLRAEGHKVIADAGPVTPKQLVVPQGTQPLDGQPADSSYGEIVELRSISIEHPHAAHAPVSIEPVLFGGLSNSLTTASSTRAKDRQHPPERLDLGKTTPEEIEIHIDRIEVTALPQIPQQPSARPNNKGLSLDEYLKRRDVRA